MNDELTPVWVYVGTCALGYFPQWVCLINFGNQISIRFERMTNRSQIGQRRGLDWWAEGRKNHERWREECRVWMIGVRCWGGGGQGCSSITSPSSPGVGFSKTDSERSGLDSISHKSWHVTLMDVGHKASRSDMWRATWRTMGKCECSRLMSTRPGSEEGMIERREDGGQWEIRGAERGIEKVRGPRAECEKAQRLWEHSNRICRDTAMIQLSSNWLKLMLLVVQWVVPAYL